MMKPTENKPPTHQPFMWVCSKESDDDRANFIKQKLEKMSYVVDPGGPYLNTGFALENFWMWVTYFKDHAELRGLRLNVYFGINDAKKVVLIFTPMKAMEDDNDDVSYVFKKNWDGADLLKLLITPEQKRKWRENFVKAMYLTDDEKKDPDNQYYDRASGSNLPSDTRSVSYCWDDIFELLETKNYFGPKADIAEDVRAYLAALPYTGARRGEKPGGFKNRILLYFDLLDSGGSNVNLANLQEFNELPVRNSSLCPRPKSLDNGQLCPTTCD